MRVCISLGIALIAIIATSGRALSWGNDGHEIVALIADHYLHPDARNAVRAMLANDADDLTKHDIASEATWADQLRNTPAGRARTAAWHFVDIEIDSPNLDTACFNHPLLSPGTAASNGPAKDCVVDKIEEFQAELADQSTDPEERIVALKFLLHFVGDVHQPLHAADRHDRGGNEIRVSAAGFHANNLHHYWDTEFVDQLGESDDIIATDLIKAISAEQVAQWSSGTARDWALESFALARDHAYGKLGQPNSRGSYRLDEAYITDATDVVAGQLSRAGVRLAFIINTALGNH